MTKCYIFDLDGTLCNGEHRVHHVRGDKKNFDAYLELCDLDTPIPHMVELVNILSKVHPIIYMSGRMATVHSKTVTWNFKHLPDGLLMMRKAGDYRPDYEVKKEMLEEIRANGWDPIMAFDDRDQVVKMWRALGVPCAQVAEGDF